MEITTDKKSAITLFGRAHSQLQKTIFQHSHHHYPHIFASNKQQPSYMLPRQMPFCQTAPVLPSVTQQQNGMEWWWDSSTSAAIPLTSASDIMGQHSKTGGITFGATLIHYYFIFGYKFSV